MTVAGIDSIQTQKISFGANSKSKAVIDSVKQEKDAQKALKLIHEVLADKEYGNLDVLNEMLGFAQEAGDKKLEGAIQAKIKKVEKSRQIVYNKPIPSGQSGHITQKDLAIFNDKPSLYRAAEKAYFEEMNPGLKYEDLWNKAKLAEMDQSSLKRLSDGSFVDKNGIRRYSSDAEKYIREFAEREKTRIMRDGSKQQGDAVAKAFNRFFPEVNTKKLNPNVKGLIDKLHERNVVYDNETLKEMFKEDALTRKNKKGELIFNNEDIAAGYKYIEDNIRPNQSVSALTAQIEKCKTTKDVVRLNNLLKSKKANLRNELMKEIMGRDKYLLNKPKSKLSQDEIKKLDRCQQKVNEILTGKEAAYTDSQKLLIMQYDEYQKVGDKLLERKRTLFKGVTEVADDVIEGTSKNTSKTVTKAAEEAAEETGSKAKEVAKDVAEKGKEAAKKIGPWGWVAIVGGALIAIIAGVSAHNKNKQQQQLNAVA